MSGALVIALLAAGVGLGLFIFLRALRPRPVELADTVLALQQRRGPRSLGREPAAPDMSPFQRLLSRPGMRLLGSTSLTDTSLLEDRLRVLGKSVEHHAYEKMLAAVFGLVLPLLVAAILAIYGVAVSPLLVLLGSLILGGLGFLYPDLPLAERVRNRQQAFRHSLASYLELVSIILAGGGGTESALVGAAQAGDGWVFAEIRSALRRGELTGKTPWEMFEELGEQFGIDELRELASSVSLAGGHGARVRQSLVSKAEAMRAQQTAEIESSAESNTEKMIVPVSIMVLGLMVFIGVGALDAISGGPSQRADAVEVLNR